MIKASQKASLWWLFTKTGPAAKCLHILRRAHFYPHHFIEVDKMVGIVFL